MTTAAGSRVPALRHFSGQRVTLRDLCLSYLDPLGYWLQPGHAWHRLDGPYYPPPTPDEIAAMHDKWQRAITAQDWPPLRQRLVIACAADDTLLGMVSRYWISEETHWTAIGISIYDPGNWSQGLGYEALGLWCQYLFDREPRFVRLDLRTWSGNRGMVRLAEKLGFTREAVFRMARIVDGQYYDGLGYGILRSEWDAQFPGGFGG